MKKHILVICLMLNIILILQTSASEAGTFFLGVKGWYTMWDSAIMDYLEKDIAVSFAQNRVQFQAQRDDGEGYLIGPLFGYQTDDGKWAFSFAPMIISDFTQDWDGSAGSMNLRGEADLERQDYDLAVTYTLSQYFKVFAGYKYQDMKLDFDLIYDTIMGSQLDTFIVEAQAHIPTFGIGLAYPINEKIAVSGQAGLLYPMMDMEISSETGATDDILPQARPGFNSEVNLTYQPMKNILVQLGYRYQMFEFKGRSPGKTEAITSRDITHGVTLSTVYIF